MTRRQAELRHDVSTDRATGRAGTRDRSTFPDRTIFLFNLDRAGKPYRLEIPHPAWPLRPAEVRLVPNAMAEASGIRLPGRLPLLHFSERQDMVGWGPSMLAG